MLVIKGYNVIKIRHRNNFGEIDIIARKGKTLVFTEVKARKYTDVALYSVTPEKQKVLSKAATAFTATNKKYLHLGLRFDVMVVTSPIRIHHFKNAWRV